jgi:hypothetical protein
MLDFMYQVLPAIERALITDLPDVLVPEWKSPDGKRARQAFKRRPNRAELNLYVFPQIWSTTALGFDVGNGAAGQAFTAAYTVVAIHEAGIAAVYFGGSFAYLAPMSSDLWDDIHRCEMRSLSQRSHYGRVLPDGSEFVHSDPNLRDNHEEA